MTDTDHPKFLSLYFGCLKESGHFAYMHREYGYHHTVYHPKEQVPGFPWMTKHLDGGLLENGQVPDKPDGKVYWTCGGKPDLWFAFYWWDRSGDKRGASNSGFYVRGFQLGEERQAFEYACEQWPEVVSRQHHPLQLVERSPGAPR